MRLFLRVFVGFLAVVGGLVVLLILFGIGAYFYELSNYIGGASVSGQTKGPSNVSGILVENNYGQETYKGKVAQIVLSNREKEKAYIAKVGSKPFASDIVIDLSADLRGRNNVQKYAALIPSEAESLLRDAMTTAKTLIESKSSEISESRMEKLKRIAAGTFEFECKGIDDFSYNVDLSFKKESIQKRIKLGKGDSGVQVKHTDGTEDYIVYLEGEGCGEAIFDIKGSQVTLKVPSKKNNDQVQEIVKECRRIINASLPNLKPFETADGSSKVLLTASEMLGQTKIADITVKVEPGSFG